MIAVLSFLVIVALSVLVNRVATIALVHTGLSKEEARFQAPSAFTGVGYTTAEAEDLVSHPVRRKIVMLLMLLGNAGLATAISSLILSFANNESGESMLFKSGVILAGLALMISAANNPLVDRRLYEIIDWALRRYTTLGVHDYYRLLGIKGGYEISEICVGEKDWIVSKTLGESRLRDEGVIVLSIWRRDGAFVGAPRKETTIKAGDVLVLYGRAEALLALDFRRQGRRGDSLHAAAVEEQVSVELEQKKTEQKSS